MAFAQPAVPQKAHEPAQRPHNVPKYMQVAVVSNRIWRAQFNMASLMAPDIILNLIVSYLKGKALAQSMI
jgi:hypothetical protein